MPTARSILPAEPALSAAVLRVARREHVFLFAVHHIAADGWSLEVLVRELQALYRARVDGETADLPAVPVTYADFVRWQRRRWERGTLKAQLEYWRRQLEDAPAELDLPFDVPWSERREPHAGSRLFRIPPSVAVRLRAWSRLEGASLFMTLLAVWQLLLARFSGQRDLTTGTAVAGRSQPDLEQVVGHFANTLVLRARLEGGISFSELVANTRRTVLDAQVHQDLPFALLVEVLSPPRSDRHPPFFQVWFGLENLPASPVDPEGLTAHSFDVDVDSVRFDLSLQVRESAGGCWCQLQYAADLFDSTTMARLERSYLRALEAMLDAPEAAALGVSLLSPAEHQHLLREWNDTEVCFGPVVTMDERLAARASDEPDRSALVGEGETLSFRALWARARDLAGQLNRLGIGEESRVGVLAERSIARVVLLSAVTLAGAAYVPLTPGDPARRRRRLFEDSGARALLVAGDLEVGWSCGPVPVLRVDEAGRCGVPGVSEPAPFLARRSRCLRPVHLRFDRSAERGGCQSSGSGEPPRLGNAANRLGPRRPRDAQDALWIRRLGHRALCPGLLWGYASDRRAGGFTVIRLAYPSRSIANG